MSGFPLKRGDLTILSRAGRAGRPGKPDHPMFTGAIGRVAYVAAFESVNRGDVHDRGPALLQHRRDLEFHAHLHGLEAGVHHPSQSASSTSATGTCTGPTMPALLTAQSSLPNLAS